MGRGSSDVSTIPKRHGAIKEVVKSVGKAELYRSVLRLYADVDSPFRVCCERDMSSVPSRLTAAEWMSGKGWTVGKRAERPEAEVFNLCCF